MKRVARPHFQCSRSESFFNKRWLSRSRRVGALKAKTRLRTAPLSAVQEEASPKQFLARSSAARSRSRSGGVSPQSCSRSSRAKAADDLPPQPARQGLQRMHGHETCAVVDRHGCERFQTFCFTGHRSGEADAAVSLSLTAAPLCLDGGAVRDASAYRQVRPQRSRMPTKIDVKSARTLPTSSGPGCAAVPRGFERTQWATPPCLEGGASLHAPRRPRPPPHTLRRRHPGVPRGLDPRRVPLWRPSCRRGRSMATATVGAPCSRGLTAATRRAKAEASPSPLFRERQGSPTDAAERGERLCPSSERGRQGSPTDVAARVSLKPPPPPSRPL